MSGVERSGYRSLVYSGWHRTASVQRYVGVRDAARLTMIDVDSCEYCAVCRSPVALVETAQTVAQPKAAWVTARLAKLARIPAYSVSYTGDIERDRCGTCGRDHEHGEIRRFLVRRIEPDHPRVGDMDPEAYARFLLSLRTNHRCVGGEQP